MKNTVKKLCCLMLTSIMVISGSGVERIGTVFEEKVVTVAEAAESTELQFTGYKKIGDTVTVANASAGASYAWTVTSQITGQVVHTETNTTGTLKTSQDYNECMITCTVDGQTLSMYCTTLPVMYIDCGDAYYDVLKEDYSDATIKLVGNEEYSDESFWYDGAAEIKLRGNSTAYRAKRPFRIKLDKKANLLGLGTEDNGEEYKSKHWVLLANDIDHTLIRNKLLYDFSGAIGTEVYFHSENVALIYNGEYAGVYQLCEHRRVDEGRIDITDWVGIGEDAAADIAEAEYAAAGYAEAGDMEDALNEVMYQDYSWMDDAAVTLKGKTYNFADYDIELPDSTGGYLAEMDFYNIYSDQVASIKTAYGQPLYFSAPEAGSDAADIAAGVVSFKQTELFDYALRYTQAFEYAIHSEDFTFNSGTHSYITSMDALDRWNNNYTTEDGWTSSIGSQQYIDEEHSGKHYSELFDMDSLVNNFLFVEYVMNWDSMKNSFFYYKDVDGLAKVGPQWDFDWSLGNVNMYNINTWYPASWQTTVEFFTNEQPYQSFNWNRMLIKDPYFLVRVYEKYQEIRGIIGEMVDEGGTIDQQVEYLEMAGQANDARWSYTYDDNNDMGMGYAGMNGEDFETSIANLKRFLNTRVAWLDAQFASIDSLVNSLGYYQEAEDIDVTADVEADGNTIVAVTKNPDCKKVVFQLNGTVMYEADVVDGVATVIIPSNESICDGVTKNVVVAYEVDANGEYILNTDLKPSGNYEYIAKSAFTTFVRDSSGLSGEQEKNGATESFDKLEEVGQTSELIELIGDGEVSVIVEVLASRKDGKSYFWAEMRDTLYDEGINSKWFTTVSRGQAWFANTMESVPFEYEGNDLFADGNVDTQYNLEEGHNYQVIFRRVNGVLSVYYYDLTSGEEIGTVSGTPVDAFNETIYCQIQGRAGAFKVISQSMASLDEGDVVLEQASFEYDGNAKTPTVSVELWGEEIEPEYYTVKYYNNVETGTAVVYVEATEDNGIYAGSVMKTFDIVKTAVGGDFTYGDANSDGRINVMDAVLMKKQIAGFENLTINLDACDVNVDGRLNVMDAVKLLKYIAGFDNIVLGEK